MEELLIARRSFAVETTLAGQLHLRDVNRAKSESWQVGIVYVGLKSPNLALERVRQRTLAGGQNVPETDIRRRYDRSLVNLARIGQIAAALFVFDNSSKNLKMVVVANRGEVVFRSPTIPAWVKRGLGAIIN